MMTTIETYVRTGRSNLRKWALDPRIRLGAKSAACLLGGFVLSAASLAHTALPLAMGLVCALTGWRALLAAAGGAVCIYSMVLYLTTLQVQGVSLRRVFGRSG